jgi:hypothetical protein
MVFWTTGLSGSKIKKLYPIRFGLNNAFVTCIELMFRIPTQNLIHATSKVSNFTFFDHLLSKLFGPISKEQLHELLNLCGCDWKMIVFFFVYPIKSVHRFKSYYEKCEVYLQIFYFHPHVKDLEFYFLWNKM